MKEIVEIIRCENCKHSILKRIVGDGISEPPYVLERQCTKLMLAPMKDNDYCSYAEERPEKPCFIPNDSAYLLCVGKGSECKTCCVYEKMDEPPFEK